MTCGWCHRGFLRSFGEHLHVSERGITVLGPCTAPDEWPGDSMPVDAFRERLAAVTERLRAPAVAAILAPTNPDAPQHWTDEEDD